MEEEMIQNLACRSSDYLQYETDEVITWCGGCGNYAIQNALKRALTLEQIKQEEVLFCFDIGCNGNGSDKIEGYTIHGLHGRVLPLAAGAKIANPKMKVIASAGDGGTLSEGVNHLIHAVRSDYPILFILHDNNNYALTTGQASATTPCGSRMNGTPNGVTEDRINAMDLVLSSKPSFVARTISADVNHMTSVFRQALNHTGFVFVEVLQSCPTYAKELTNNWMQEHTQDVTALPDYDASSIGQARQLLDNPKKLPIGLIYQNKEKRNFLEILSAREGIETSPREEVKPYDIENFLAVL